MLFWDRTSRFSIIGIEAVYSNTNTDTILLTRDSVWSSQLCTLSPHGLNKRQEFNSKIVLSNTNTDTILLTRDAFWSSQLYTLSPHGLTNARNLILKNVDNFSSIFLNWTIFSIPLFYSIYTCWIFELKVFMKGFNTYYYVNIIALFKWID